MRIVVCPLLLTFLLAACTAAPPSTPPPTNEEDLTFGEALAPTPSPSPKPPRPAEPPPSPAPAAEKHVISVSVQNWSFSPSVITVKQGEMVELHLQGVSGTHGFSVPGLGINVPVSPGEAKTVTLPTDTLGTFAGLCSIPCGAGHSDMKFSVIVEP